MYLLFYLVFNIFVVNSIIVKHQFQDNHPFITDDVKQKSMLIPSIGYEMNDEPGRFTCTLNGWYYLPLTPSYIQSVIKVSFQTALNLLGGDETNSEEEKEDRFGSFLVRDVEDYSIQLKLSDSISHNVSTDDNGRFHETIIVDSLEGLNIKGNVLKYIALGNDHPEQGNEGTIYIMKHKNHGGCSIISDIDDTIKISDVPHKQNLMINTFKKDFIAVPGMSDVYRSWKSSYKCLIHYVSAMPSQLYYTTQKFLDREKFPGGSFHMRHLKVVGYKSKHNLFNKIIEFVKHDASQKHKIIVIQNILDNAPNTQQFVMVGDSGELDPEIYGKITRKNPDKIKMIFIRLVDGGINNNNRFKTAFEDVPKDKWSLFSQSSELPRKLYDDNDPININHGDDDSNSMNNANILSTSLFYYILPILLMVLITMTYTD